MEGGGVPTLVHLGRCPYFEFTNLPLDKVDSIYGLLFPMPYGSALIFIYPKDSSPHVMCLGRLIKHPLMYLLNGWFPSNQTTQNSPSFVSLNIYAATSLALSHSFSYFSILLGKRYCERVRG